MLLTRMSKIKYNKSNPMLLSKINKCISNIRHQTQMSKCNRIMIMVKISKCKRRYLIMAPMRQKNSISKFKNNLKICCKSSMRKKNYNNFSKLRGKDKCYGSTSRWRCIQDTNARNTIEKGTEEEKKTLREISNMKGKRKK